MFVPSSVIGPGLGASTQCATRVTSPPVQLTRPPPTLLPTLPGAPGSPPPRPSRSMRSTSRSPSRATQGETGRTCRGVASTASTDGARRELLEADQRRRQHRQLAGAVPLDGLRGAQPRRPLPLAAEVARLLSRWEGGREEPRVEAAVLERRRHPAGPRPQAARPRPRAPSRSAPPPAVTVPAARPVRRASHAGDASSAASGGRPGRGRVPSSTPHSSNVSRTAAARTGRSSAGRPARRRAPRGRRPRGRRDPPGKTSIPGAKAIRGTRRNANTSGPPGPSRSSMTVAAARTGGGSCSGQPVGGRRARPSGRPGGTRGAPAQPRSSAQGRAPRRYAQHPRR